MFLFYKPAMTRSVAFSNFSSVIYSILSLAARIAASLQVFAN